MSKTALIAGNFEFKYQSKNPISKKLVNGFIECFIKNINKVASPKKILEVGAGEGYLIEKLYQIFPQSHYTVTDYDDQILSLAKKRLSFIKSNIDFAIADAHKLQFASQSYDLVICCEVLEHLPDPEVAIKEIHRVLKKGGTALFSVPREPLWRLLNIIRFHYLKDFGNTPGHLQHFNADKLSNLLTNKNLTIIEVNHPLPWIMIRCNKS